MAYNEFTLKEIENRFGLTVTERADLFDAAPEVEPGPILREQLAVMLPMALDINTEKARSELVVAPLLLEVYRRFDRRISFFSGVAFDVDPAQGLTGFCAFLLSRSPQQLFIRAPVAVITEAKNEDVKAGMGQCLAAMIAARLFNERDGERTEPIFGAVTTGSVWRFLRLDGPTASVDHREYYLFTHLDKIFGIFVNMFTDTADPAGVRPRPRPDRGQAA